MMSDTRISADDFYRASKALKAAGDKNLRKELNRRLRLAAKPLIPKARAEATRTLPTRGGLAKRVASSPMRVQVRTGRETAGVRVVVGKRRGSAARTANEGTIKHPVFDTGRWVSQEVEPGWFDDTMRRHAPEVRPDVEDAVRTVLGDIARQGRGSG